MATLKERNAEQDFANYVEESIVLTRQIASVLKALSNELQTMSAEESIRSRFPLSKHASDLAKLASDLQNKIETDQLLLSALQLPDSNSSANSESATNLDNTELSPNRTTAEAIESARREDLVDLGSPSDAVKELNSDEQECH